MALPTYLPQDRLRALAQDETLPDRTHGSALFADISGFTPLTEALREALGPRRGAEELTKHLEAVYTTLITEVEHAGGSVIGFAGDAITCWFDEAQGPAAARATAGAFGLQHAMRAFRALALPNGQTVALTLKVAVASGAARRLVVGDPAIQYLDALAGAPVTRTSLGEHLANKGEILLDEATTQILGTALTLAAWRTDEGSGEKFAVVTQYTGEAALPPLPPPPRALAAPELQAWVDDVVYERALAGAANFQTEFRPCVALFVRFVGLDYEADEAQPQLDTFIRQLQTIVERYKGVVLQLTIGDKGSYLYANFGAVTSHEDDARRAVKAALEIKNKSTLQLQMGIAQGVMRVGPYGGQTRQTFGALGDEVNLAARLMTTAAVGEILVSGTVHKTVAHTFLFEPRPALKLKGKTEPVTAFVVLGENQPRALRLQEPNYALPMVGRARELQIISEKLALAVAGQSQVIGISAEAGLGKSRLIAEVIRAARQLGFVGYGGTCQSDARNTPYQAWKAVWQAFFDLDHEMSLKKQLRLIEGEIADHAPTRVDALPLLNIVLDLEIPDNPFTKMLEPQYRKSVLHGLLEDCLRAAAQATPLLVVIEDLHWIDALSHDLLEELARALNDRAVCWVLAYRPPQLARLAAPRLEALPNFTKIELSELNTAEAETAIRAKLAQLYPARAGAVPLALVDQLMARAQGNPFYLEELLNYLHDRGLDPRDPADLARLELPDSLHTLILSRIDYLNEHEKNALRVASVIGRQFRVDWLLGYYPALGSAPQVITALNDLATLDLTPLDTPDPELAYLFKHIVIHEVTYESLPFATRALLHEQLARYLESAAPDYVDALAYHYGRSANVEKQRHYFQRAGEAAQKNFANEAALAYYAALLPLLDPPAQIAIRLKRGAVLELLGQWAEAEQHYQAARAQAQAVGAGLASAQFALGKLHRLRGEYATARTWLTHGLETYTAQADLAGQAQVLIEIGLVLMYQGDYEAAQAQLHAGLRLVQAAGDQLNMALALNNLGIVARRQGDYATARTLYEESLALRRAIGERRGAATLLNNLGIVASEQGDTTRAHALYEESLTLMRSLGDKAGVATALGNLGLVASEQGDYTRARPLYEESLALRRAMGDKPGVAITLSNLGLVATAQGDYGLARRLYEESLTLRRTSGDKLGIVTVLNNFGNLALAQNDLTTARRCYAESLTLAHEAGIKREMIYSLGGLAAVQLGVGRGPDAVRLAAASETGRLAIQLKREAAESKIYANTLTTVHATLDAATLATAWAEGEQWTLEEAVQQALLEETR